MSTSNEDDLKRDNFWQTKYRGTNEAEYEIYVAAAEDLGWTVKTHEEWLAS